MKIGTYNFTAQDYKILDGLALEKGHSQEIADQLSLYAVQNTYDVDENQQLDCAIATVEMYLDDQNSWPLKGAKRMIDRWENSQ